MGATVGAIFGIILTAIIIGVILGGFFMFIGAKISGIKNVAFGKAVLTSIACGVISFIVPLVFSIVPVLGTMIGFFVSLFCQIFIIKSMFDTDIGKALLTWIFNLVAQIIAFIVAFMILGTSLASVAD